jgi:cbb3-type cytochrome oxidase maturation protein
MYYPYFITYIIVGFVISLLVFFWALRNGQFKDQERARFLPLRDEDKTGKSRVSRLNRFEVFALGGLACGGLLATAAVLIFALFIGKG